MCITGGEPTVHKELPSFIRRMKEMGYQVKLDTNGYNPGMLRRLIKENLVDYVAMDIKSSPEKYSEVANVDVDIRKIEESIKLIAGSGIDHVFRTTVIPRHHDHKELLSIKEWLLDVTEKKRLKSFHLQQFYPREGSMLDSSYEKERPHPRERLEEFRKSLEPHFEECKVRN